MRYTKQFDKSGCGPTAIANAIKWAIESFSYKGARRYLYDMSRLVKGCGVPPWGINTCLRELTEGILTVQKRIQPRLREIDKRLQRGDAMIILYKIKKDWNHYVFVAGKTERGDFMVANKQRNGPAMRNYSRQLFKRDVLREHEVWFLRRV